MGKGTSSNRVGRATKKRPGEIPGGRRIPWVIVSGAAAVIALLAVIAVSVIPQYQDDAKKQRFTPSAQQPDPSAGIAGVTTAKYPGGRHVADGQRVAYDKAPPFGGPHDQVWATCTGTVYPQPIRTENAVHSLEHGAVWIAYDPARLTPEQTALLEKKVAGESYMLMSPYPGLDHAISLQSWGHQLKLDDPNDERIDQFITALRLNQHTYPEVGASCSNPYFDTQNPPPFDPTPPGPDAVPMTGAGA